MGSPGEELLFQKGDVSVTPTRIVVGPRMYPIVNITSVGRQTAGPARAGSILFVLASVLPLCLLIAINENSLVFILVCIGILSGSSLALAALFYFGLEKPTYYVTLTTAAGEARIVSTRDSLAALAMVKAIHEAVVRRQGALNVTISR